MKKGLRIACKILSVFLSILLVVQIAPMEIMANAYNEATVNENTENALDVSTDEVDTTESKAEIIAEETSKREENVKHFRMSDGSYKAAQYDVPVHFMLNGEWTDYDNTLTEVDADDEENENKLVKNKDLKNTLADYTVRLSKKTNGKKFVRIEKDGYKLSWYYINAKKSTAQIAEIAADDDDATLEKLSSRVTYEDVYKNTDFEYIISSNGLKENIILKKSNAKTTFEAEYKANGLTPVQVDSHTINLVSEDDTIVFILSAPYMMDANGETSTDVSITLSNVKNNSFTVTTNLDESWLDDENRAYPVTIDPLIKTKKEYGESDSTFVGAKYPDRCYHTYSTDDSGSLYVGNIYGYGQTESYLKVNTLPTLGVADKVVYAQLDMGLITCELGMQVDVKRVTEAWSMSSITWNNKPEPDDEILDYKVLNGGETWKWISFEITDLVRGWYSGEYPNYGVSFSTTKTSSAKVWMCSTDFSERGFVENRPVLLVHYRNMSGYEDYWSYTGLSAGRNGAVSVNNYNGNLVFTQPLTQGDGGNLMPVALSLVYNSNGKNAEYTYMAKNMQTNYHIFVRYDSTTAADGYKYYLNDADGTRHWFYFEKNEDGSLKNTGKDEDGLGYTFDVINKGDDALCTYTNGDDYARFRITDKDKNKMYFNCAGNLIQITNANGVSATVQYETVEGSLRIKSITDGAGRVYAFGYHPYYAYLCVSITDPAGRKTSFLYGDGLMKSLTFPDGKTYSLYYTNRELTNIGSIDGTRTAVVYGNTSQKRVTNINWGTSDSSLLESYSFAYKQNETKVTDIQGRSYTYQFNDFGQNTGIVSNADGAAQYFEYKDVGTNKADINTNKLISQSKVINTVTNYVINPGFARDFSNGYLSCIADTTGSPTVSIDTTKGNITKNSLKVYKPSTNTNIVFAVQKHFNLEAGTYTLSGYIDTAGATLTGKGAYFGVEFWNSSGYQYSQRAELIKQTDGWQRVSLTFTIPAGHELRIVLGLDNYGTNSYGTVWFDDLQLEKGTGMSSYNMVENGGLTNGATAWMQDTLTSSNVVEGFNKALYLNGDAQTHWQRLGQYISPANTKVGDVYSFGAWVKADSIPINDLKTGDSCIPEFYLGIHFYDANGTWMYTEKVELNDDINTWQFVSGKAVAKQAYSQIRVELVYYYNANTAYITGAFCFREEFGQTYTYDKDGNISSVVDLANSESDFAFSGGQMAKMLNPSGSRYLYSYDEQNKLNYALSSDGQQYAFEYDDKGNVTNSEITARKPATTLEAGKEYIIVNAYSGKALDSGSTGNLGNDTFTSPYDPESVYQHWKLESTGTLDVYRLTPAGFPDKTYLCLDVSDSLATDGAIIQIYQWHSNSAQKFKIVKDTDNTFTIAGACSNYAKVLDAQYEEKDLDEKQIVKQKTLVIPNTDESVKWYFYPVEETEDKTISTSATYTDSKNFVASQTDQRGNTTTYNYNETKGTLTSITDAKNNTTSYVYDNNTNALQSVTSGGMTNSYEYDENSDRLTGISVNGGTRYAFEYDGFGRTTKTLVGKNNIATRLLSELTYDNKGRLAKQLYGNNDFIEFQYDNLDRLVNKSYNGSSTDKVQYHYGTDGRLSQIIDFSTNSRMKYVYDLAGRVVSTREYDGANLTGINLKSSVNYTYADKTNYLTGVTHFSPLGTQNIGYRYGNMAQGEMPDQIYGITWNNKNILNYTYDGLGRLTNKIIPIDDENNSPENDIITKYEYYGYSELDTDKRTTTLLKSISTLGIPHTYEYDELGNITSIEFNNSLANSYEYDDLNQLVRENNHDQGKTFTYEYVNGNIKYKHEYAYNTGTLPTTPLKTIEYHYEDSTWSDVLTKITETTYSNRSGSSTASVNSLVGDDDLGVPSNSIHTLAQSLLGDNYREVDLTANALLNVGDDDLGIPNMNTYSINSNTSTRTLYTFQSDTIGNITNVGGVVNLDWNGRRLESISQGGTVVVSYDYNIDGQRTKKTALDTETGEYITTEFFYNGEILAGQKQGDDVIIFMYDNNGDIFGFEYNGTPYYYVKNAQNDVWLILDENGQAVVLYQYDAWGRVTYGLDATDFGLIAINPIMYRSYYVDLEMGMFMYYLNSRYYMADWGRFVSADSYVQTGQGMLDKNMFAYCANNPVKYCDVTGEAFGLVILFTAAVVTVAKAVVTVAANHVENALNKKSIEKEIKSNYTQEEAKTEIDNVLNKYSGYNASVSVKFDSRGVEITNSYLVNSKYDRQKVSMIISRTEDFTERQYDNLSAEWNYHNIMYDLSINDSISNSAKDAYLDFEGDARKVKVGLPTVLFEAIGWD